MGWSNVESAEVTLQIPIIEPLIGQIKGGNRQRVLQIDLDSILVQMPDAIDEGLTQFQQMVHRIVDDGKYGRQHNPESIVWFDAQGDLILGAGCFEISAIVQGIAQV